MRFPISVLFGTMTQREANPFLCRTLEPKKQLVQWSPFQWIKFRSWHLDTKVAAGSLVELVL